MTLSVVACTVTETSVNLALSNGLQRPVTDSHPNYTVIRRFALSGQRDSIVPLLEVAEMVNRVTAEQSSGRVFVRDGLVLYRNERDNEEILRNSAAIAVLSLIRECNEAGIEPDISAMLLFIEFSMDLLRSGNPDDRRIYDELWNFIDTTRISLLPDGRFLTYKKVRRLLVDKMGIINGVPGELKAGDLVDCYTETYRNNPGDTPQMDRDKVDPDKHRTCSYGLHVCTEAYLPSYGTGSTDETIVVAVNPRDVVAVPADYNDSKMRVTGYEVLGVRKGDPHRSERELTRTLYTDEALDEALDERPVAASVVSTDTLSKDEAIVALGLQDTADPKGALRKRLARGVTCKRVFVNGEERVLILTATESEE